MVALLQRLYAAYTEIRVTRHGQRREDRGDYSGELTDDQVRYLRELAEERWLAWMEHSRET